MSEGLVVALVALVGLGIGIWLGMPGRDRQSLEDIERAMDSPAGRRRRTKRMFTPMAWVQRKVDQKASRDRGSRRRGFKLESPEERD